MLLLHTGVIGSGYIGVDIFFVLSGYLITTILVEQQETGRWSLKRFYVRRMRRLYPALVVLLVLTLPVNYLFMPFGLWHRLAVVD